MSTKTKITRLLVLALANSFRWLHDRRGYVVRALRLLSRPAVVFATFFARYILIHPYRLALALRRLLRSWGITRRTAAFAERMLVHLTVAAITLAVSGFNVYARTAATPSMGERSALFALLGGEDETFDEEVVDESPPAPAATYWNPDALEASPGGLHVDDINYEDEAGMNPQIVAGGALLPPAVAGGAASVAPRTRIEYYVVRSGDTVASIADRFAVSVNTILWENKLSARTLLRPGDRLSVLPTSGVAHTVRSGDTAEKIAKRYGSSPEKILAYVAGPLTAGERIVVPDGRPVAPPVVARPTRVVAASPAGIAYSSGGGFMAWPTSWRIITQYFRWKHSGVDIDGDYTTPLYAAEAGAVTHAGWGRTRGGYGIYVDIDHGNGLVTRYGHASKLFVQSGDSVARGQPIGMVGTTGRSTGTHLHFEVIKGGRKVNPLEYIR